MAATSAVPPSRASVSRLVASAHLPSAIAVAPSPTWASEPTPSVCARLKAVPASIGRPAASVAAPSAAYARPSSGGNGAQRRLGAGRVAHSQHQDRAIEPGEVRARRARKRVDDPVEQLTGFLSIAVLAQRQFRGELERVGGARVAGE